MGGSHAVRGTVGLWQQPPSAGEPCGMDSAGSDPERQPWIGALTSKSLGQRLD